MSQAQLLPTDHFSPTVSLFKGKPATTSLAIAEHFGKRHHHVLRDIRKLCTELAEEERATKFGLTFKTVAGPNNSERQEEFFIVYFDGFILLVMGYTGKKALQVKLAYIAAFNAMRDELAAQREAALPHVPHIQITPSTPTSRKPLEKLVKVWARQGGLIHAQCWTMLNAAFNLQCISDLPEEWIPDAITWVQGKIDALPKALPAPKPMRPPLLSLTPEELAALNKAAQRVEELNRHVMKEISDLHVDILESVDPSRMARTAWRVLSDYIFYSLGRAACLPSGCLEREKNPALAMKMLAGALDER